MGERDCEIGTLREREIETKRESEIDAERERDFGRGGREKMDFAAAKVYSDRSGFDLELRSEKMGLGVTFRSIFL